MYYKLINNLKTSGNEQYQPKKIQAANKQVKPIEVISFTKPIYPLCDGRRPHRRRIQHLHPEND